MVVFYGVSPDVPSQTMVRSYRSVSVFELSKGEFLMRGLVRGLAQAKPSSVLTALIMTAVIALPLAVSTIYTPVAHATTRSFPARGDLDCNGYSRLQKPLSTAL